MALPPDPLNIVSNEQPTPEEIADVLERGGPWITVTFTSEDNAFEQKRVLTLDQAIDFHRVLGEEITQATIKYNIQETNNE